MIWILQKMQQVEWIAARFRHRSMLFGLVASEVDRRSRHEADPVMDFLFEYYGQRASDLLRWSPGFGVLMTGDPVLLRDWFPSPHFDFMDGGFGLLPQNLPFHRKEPILWLRKLLNNTVEKPPFLGCFGMHEWAMVYKAKAQEIRHSSPFRLPQKEIDAFVESRAILCTHFEAFRFFTKSAQPLNIHQPTRLTMEEYEQPGCLHTNMDLYKWSAKLFPWVSSDLIHRTFLLACKLRLLDMKASPYDFSPHVTPIRVETEEGRKEYCKQQHALHLESIPLRKELLEKVDFLFQAIEAFATKK